MNNAARPENFEMVQIARGRWVVRNKVTGTQTIPRPKRSAQSILKALQK